MQKLPSFAPKQWPATAMIKIAFHFFLLRYAAICIHNELIYNQFIIAFKFGYKVGFIITTSFRRKSKPIDMCSLHLDRDFAACREAATTEQRHQSIVNRRFKLFGFLIYRQKYRQKFLRHDSIYTSRRDTAQLLFQVLQLR